MAKSAGRLQVCLHAAVLPDWVRRLPQGPEHPALVVDNSRAGCAAKPGSDTPQAGNAGSTHACRRLGAAVCAGLQGH
jgi:hypothetical protein